MTRNSQGFPALPFSEDIKKRVLHKYHLFHSDKTIVFIPTSISLKFVFHTVLLEAWEHICIFNRTCRETEDPEEEECSDVSTVQKWNSFNAETVLDLICWVWQVAGLGEEYCCLAPQYLPWYLHLNSCSCVPYFQSAGPKNMQENKINRLA